MKSVVKFFSVFIFIGFLHCNKASAQDCPVGDAFLVTTEGEVLYCDDDEWDTVANFPSGADFLPQKVIYKNGSFFIGTRFRGLYELSIKNKSLKKVASLQQRPVYLPNKPARENRRSVYGLDNQGKFVLHRQSILHWPQTENQQKALNASFGRNDSFSAVYSDNKKIYIARALNGLYSAPRTRKNKHRIKFRKDSKGLPFLYHDRRIRMYEEISAIDGDMAGNLWVATSLNAGIYRRSSRGPFREVPIANLGDRVFNIDSLFVKDTENDKISFWAGSARGLIKGNKQKAHIQKWEKMFPTFSKNKYFIFYKHNNLWASARLSTVPVLEAKAKRMEKAKGRRLFYSSAYNFKRRKRSVMNLIKRDVYNGMVIDLKDDAGRIHYNTKIPLAHKVSSVRKTIDLPELVKFMKSQNAWLVARLVIFKDAKLFRYKDFGVRDVSGKPWIGVPGERWIDPYNPVLASEYIGPMVKELEDAGIDEIQLDYIRFPSDGGIGRARFIHKKGDVTFTEALESFLARVREATSLPISADIYGYHGIYRAAGSIGQDFEAFARHVDIICPMLYSSHFGDLYLTDGPREKRAYRLLRHSALRYNLIAEGSVVVRPWLQAFPMKNSIWGYGAKYFRDQVHGADIGKNDGYTFWGAYSHILKVEKSLETR